MKRIFLTMIIIIGIIFIGQTKLQAKTVKIESSKPVYNGKVEFVPVESRMKFQPDSEVVNLGNVLYHVAAYICYGAAFIVLVIKGVQFMSAAPDAKADIKKQMIAIVIGAVIVFSIRRILGIIEGLHLF